MPDSEWNGLIQSILRGGVLEVEEQRAFEVVLAERNAAAAALSAQIDDGPRQGG